MRIDELITAAQFVIDEQGQRKAVLLDFEIWTELIARLTSLNALENDPQNSETLLTFTDSWVGDDLEQRLEEAYETRSEATF